jgi:hypothetical protein
MPASSRRLKTTSIHSFPTLFGKGFIYAYVYLPSNACKSGLNWSNWRSVKIISYWFSTCYYRKKATLNYTNYITLFIPASSISNLAISSKLFFLDVQLGSSLIDPVLVLLQEET